MNEKYEQWKNEYKDSNQCPEYDVWIKGQNQSIERAFCMVWEKLVGKPVFLTDEENLELSDLYNELNQSKDG